MKDQKSGQKAEKEREKLKWRGEKNNVMTEKARGREEKEQKLTW